MHDVKLLHFETLQRPDPELVRQVNHLEQQAYGQHGLVTPWTIVPFIRHGLVLLCRAGDQVIGVAEAMRDWKEPSRAYIYGVCVENTQQGHGVGTKLFGRLLDELQAAGCTTAELTVDPDNDGARRIYRQKYAFVETGVYSDEYGPGEDRIRMEREL